MEIKLEVLIKEAQTNIQLDNNQGVITIAETNSKELIIAQPTVYFLMKDNAVVHINAANENITQDKIEFNKVIMITPPWEIESAYLERLLITDAIENGIQLVDMKEDGNSIPSSHNKSIVEYKDKIVLILSKFGYSLEPKAEAKPAKAKPAKARHRWSKEVSQIEFHADTRESTGTIVWQKRNEMLLKAGAKLMKVAPLNKDGSVGFDAKYGDKVRSDYSDKIKNFVTTEDIILKSVNEVGLFLYFAGTNSWLEFVDANGKTIDAWTKVE